MAARPEVLIERWFPIDVIGAESMRERGASSALPPLYFLHVWWARRPLTTSRAAILASVLPVWSPDWPSHLREKFPTEESYRAWFLKLCGIFGDPVAGRKLITAAKAQGVKLKTPPYTHRRAFTLNPGIEYLQTLGELLETIWGKRSLSLLDPFAGGGSIPFEALRYGFKTYANELNPVATTILEATLDYPARFGPKLADDIRRYGQILADRVRLRLERFFPTRDGESIHAYIWARTVRCPYTGKPIPLSPNWWLKKGDKPVAARPIFDENAEAARFDVVQGKAACARVKPEEGTIRQGDAISPWARNQPVDGDYIKAEAQAGRLGEQLYALAIKQGNGLSFRPALPEDVYAAASAEAELAQELAHLEAQDAVPLEQITEVSNYDRGHRLYGMNAWRDVFAHRQLLTLGTLVREFRIVCAEVGDVADPDRATAIATYLALMIDKAADYNSRFTRWDSTRLKIVNSFDKHGYAFLWSHPEFDGAHNLVPWVAEQVADAYSGLAKLIEPPAEFFDSGAVRHAISVNQGSATDIKTLATASLDHICVDPPYEANVMYAECSDFFYVWMKRTLGALYPARFREELTNKDDEAVANEARFSTVVGKKKALALADYQHKMRAAFSEMHRVLRDDGVLTVMFTHKKVAAWDTLATSLIGAGFAIHSSWPVHTESEHSIHQARKNAAQSTILLTCRKRLPIEPVWWDDIKGKVRQVAREKAAEFEKQGIRGVDLYIATFGPTLAILSESWPVLTSEVDERTGEPKPLRPEVALDLAREEVIALRKQGLLLGRPVQFDPFTDWYLMAWDAFKAEEFPGDEARKLALALGLDLEREVIGEKRLVTKKAARVVIQQPKARRKRDMVDPDRRAFECWIDAAHTAMLLYEEDGARPCQAFLTRTGLGGDATFKACIQALLNAIPRTKEKGKFVRPEAEVLEAMRLAFFDDLVAPVEEEPRVEPQQLRIAETAAAYGDAGDADEEADEEDEDEK